VKPIVQRFCFCQTCTLILLLIWNWLILLMLACAYTNLYFLLEIWYILLTLSFLIGCDLFSLVLKLKRFSHESNKRASTYGYNSPYVYPQSLCRHRPTVANTLRLNASCDNNLYARSRIRPLCERNLQQLNVLKNVRYKGCDRFRRKVYSKCR